MAIALFADSRRICMRALTFSFAIPRLIPSTLAAAVLMVVAWSQAPPSTCAERPTPKAGDACPTNDTGLTLPPGFCATVFADGIGHARHLKVASSGVVYVNTWSGEYYG